MAAQQGKQIVLGTEVLVEDLRQGGRLQDLVPFFRVVGVKRLIEIIGVERLWAELSPDQRKDLVRVARQAQPPYP
jgi:hypothetical protein